VVQVFQEQDHSCPILSNGDDNPFALYSIYTEIVNVFVALQRNA
jgi:hypothetical protein